MKKKNWFGVKTAYIKKIRNEKIISIEERVVLIKASSHENAMKLATKESKQYGIYKYKNMFGKTVTMKPIKAMDSFIIDDKIDHLAEVYSRISIYTEDLKIVKIKDIFFGKTYKNEKNLRKNFRHA